MVLLLGSVAACAAQRGSSAASTSAARERSFFMRNAFRLSEIYCGLAMNMMTSLTERSVPPEGMLTTSPRK